MAAIFNKVCPNMGRPILSCHRYTRIGSEEDGLILFVLHRRITVSLAPKIQYRSGSIFSPLYYILVPYLNDQTADPQSLVHIPI